MSHTIWMCFVSQKVAFPLMNRCLHTLNETQSHIYARDNSKLCIEMVKRCFQPLLPLSVFQQIPFFTSLLKNHSVMNGTICIALQLYVFIKYPLNTKKHYITMHLFLLRFFHTHSLLCVFHYTPLLELKYRFRSYAKTFCWLFTECVRV